MSASASSNQIRRSPAVTNAADAPSGGSVLWRYVAIDGGKAHRQGELTARCAADVRASLRRIGLQVIDVRPVRAARTRSSNGRLSLLRDDLHAWWCKRCRAQRSSNRAELYDSLATMLASGMPLLEAMQTIIESRDDAAPANGHAVASRRNRAPRRRGVAMFVSLREQLRDGESLASAMRGHPDWFDVIDIAMVEAAEHSGTLPSILAGLALRQERSNELSHKLLGALAYPLLVMLVGLGVVIFLSVKTLPDLAKILTDARLPVPALTARVMWFGQFLAGHWALLGLLGVVGALASVVAPRMLGRLSVDAPPWVIRMSARIGPPRILRRLLVGSLVAALSELLRSGVPMVDSLRVLAPTIRSQRLRRTLTDAAQRIERGEDLSAALDDGRWFDAEMRRLLDIGQASGELDDMLTRIGARYERRAKRLIDQLTALLEPLVILILAVLVGTVVISAILPLIALQEIIR